MKQTLFGWLDSDVGYSFRKSPTAIVAAVIAFICVFCAVFAPWVAPHNPFDLATLSWATRACRQPGSRMAGRHFCSAPTTRGATSSRR